MKSSPDRVTAYADKILEPSRLCPWQRDMFEAAMAAQVFAVCLPRRNNKIHILRGW